MYLRLRAPRSRRQRAFEYLRGLGDETLRRFVAFVAYLQGIPPEIRSF